MNSSRHDASVHDEVASAFAAWSAGLRWQALGESTQPATREELRELDDTHDLAVLHAGASAVPAALAAAEPIADSVLLVGARALEASGSFGTLCVEVSEALGHPDQPLTAAELLNKFCANAALAGIDDALARRLACEVLALDGATDIGPLVRVLQRVQCARPAGAL